MALTPMTYAKPYDFLLAHSGTYHYRPRWRLFGVMLFMVFALGTVIVAFKMFVQGETGALDDKLMVIFAPWLLWATFSYAFRFKTLEISEEGIRFEPIGINIDAGTIEEVRFKENSWGARAIELRLGSPRWAPHLNAWIWGKKAFMPFNQRMLLPKDEI